MSLYGQLGLVKWPHLNKLKKCTWLSVIGLKIMSQKKLHPRHVLSTEVHLYQLTCLLKNWLDIINNDTCFGISGSVNGSNCAELAKEEDIDGFLVGGASLKVIFAICFLKE